MKRYRVEVWWAMYDTLEIEAESREQAIEQAYHAPLTKGEYYDDSFEVSHIEEIVEDENGHSRCCP